MYAEWLFRHKTASLKEKLQQGTKYERKYKSYEMRKPSAAKVIPETLISF